MTSSLLWSAFWPLQDVGRRCFFSPWSPVIPWIFATSWLWMFYWIPDDVRQFLPEEFRIKRQELSFMKVGLLQETALLLPAFWFGGRAVLRML